MAKTIWNTKSLGHWASPNCSRNKIRERAGRVCVRTTELRRWDFSTLFFYCCISFRCLKLSSTVKIYASGREVPNVSAHALKAAWGQHQQAYIDPSNSAAASVSQYRGQPYILTLCSNSALELWMCAHESSLHKVKAYCNDAVLAFLSSECNQCQAHTANRRCADCIDPVP